MHEINKEDLFKRYLDWNENNIRAIISRGVFCDKSKFVTPVLDLPILKNDTAYCRFFTHAREVGFEKFNIGLTRIWNKKLPRDFFKVAKKIGINFVSAHGTSLKYSLKFGVPYGKVLFNDKNSLSLVGKNGLIINYDLFAGHLPSLSFTKNFKKTSLQNSLGLSREIGQTNFLQDPEKYIVTFIIKNLANIFTTENERRCLTLEINGTKGWSMLPSPGLLLSDYILYNLKTFLPEAGVTIDVAHLLTWGRGKDSMLKAKRIVDKYRHILSMLHICSAGTDNKFFLALYKSVHKDKYPNWHINSLDASLFIFELEMINLISYIRKKIRHPFLEVSESRLPSLTIKDYFPDSGINTDDEWFYKMLMSHSKILRYV